MNDKPDCVKHLLNIGFNEIKEGKWKLIWQGDRYFYDTILRRKEDLVLTDRGNWSLNGEPISEKDLLNIK